MREYIKPLMFIFLSVSSLFSSEPEQVYSLNGTAELGFLGVASHKAQFSNNNTYFDYKNDGGQDILAPFVRLDLDFNFKQKHHLVFLYQPLSLVTKETLDKDLTVDNVLFQQGTPMEFRYDFPFWRLSYLYDFSKNPNRELAFGISFQIRNARIEFTSLNGEQFRSTRDIGPVPILKTRIKQEFTNGLWAGLEADGFYAPVSYINGSENKVVGAILDASIRTGIKLKNGSPFLNLRYLGGGAEGTSSDTNGAGDGYVRNWLHFYSVSIGYTHPLF